MQDFVFVVHCERISKRQAYYLRFAFNEQLVQRIKELPKDTRKWNPDMMVWEVTTPSLFALIKKYKASNKIRFDFGNETSRNVFIQQIKKIEIAENEKHKFVANLNIQKEQWVQYKKELEETYEQYSDQCHALLRDGVKLYPHQIVAAMFMNVTRNTLISHEMGIGKSQPLDAKLLVPNGWIRMGDVRVNDLVIGSDGKPKRVLGVYPQGLKDIYEVFFSDGTSVECSDEHLWSVSTCVRNGGENSFTAKTLREIMDGGLRFKNGSYKWYIPTIKPVEFESKNLRIDPYLLGCLLVDESAKHSMIEYSTTDKEILLNVKNGHPNNLVVNKNFHKDYTFIGENKKELVLNDELKRLNLLGANSYTKFIPHDYKFGSTKQRVEVLQGILDTKGRITKWQGLIEITLVSKQLAEDVQFIVESLGGTGKLHEKRTGHKDERGLYYRLLINLPSEFSPFLLKRKTQKYISPTGYLPNRAIVNVKYVGKKDAQCIMVDSDDHLYATDHCILTHNTLSSILYVEMNRFEKVLVITPNSLKFNFYNEVEKFTNSTAHVVNWNKNRCGIEDAKYVIVNYEFFNSGSKDKFMEKWNRLKIEAIDAVISDECQRIKNTKTNTYKNFKRIVDNKKMFRNGKVSKIFLSGTPAPNRAYELYTVLHEISPLDFPTKNYFYEYYCGMTYNFDGGWGYVTNTMEQKFEELYHKIAPYTHRKRKFEVLKDLPDKLYQKIILELSGEESVTYNKIEEGVANEFVEHPTSNPLTIMIRLRQYVALLKIKHVAELVDSILETGEKIVIVDVFKETLYNLKERFKNIAVLHTGDQSIEERADNVKLFQDPNSEVKIFLGSIQTCNYGLTLTAASKLFILTLPYSVGEYDQVSDRLHRIGQKSVVNIYPMIFRDTIDDYVFSAIESKRKEIVKVIDNEDYKSNVNESVLSDVIAKIKSKHKKDNVA